MDLDLLLEKCANGPIVKEWIEWAMEVFNIDNISTVNAFENLEFLTTKIGGLSLCDLMVKDRIVSPRDDTVIKVNFWKNARRTFNDWIDYSMDLMQERFDLEEDNQYYNPNDYKIQPFRIGGRTWDRDSLSISNLYADWNSSPYEYVQELLRNSVENLN